MLNQTNRILCELCLSRYGVDTQLTVLTEECAELIKEASKSLRGYERPEKLKEELIDVIVMTEQLRLMLDISMDEVNDKAAEKLRRALSRWEERRRDIYGKESTDRGRGPGAWKV